VFILFILFSAKYLIGFFVIGNDSPVKTASFITISPYINMQSQHINWFTSISIKSPGTKSQLSIYSTLLLLIKFIF
jgi:hypothetical protein